MVTRGEHRFLDGKLWITIAVYGSYPNGQNSADQIVCSDPKCEGIRDEKGLTLPFSSSNLTRNNGVGSSGPFETTDKPLSR